MELAKSLVGLGYLVVLTSGQLFGGKAIEGCTAAEANAKSRATAPRSGRHSIAPPPLVLLLLTLRFGQRHLMPGWAQAQVAASPGMQLVAEVAEKRCHRVATGATCEVGLGHGGVHYGNGCMSAPRMAAIGG
jgi:hypothetical protein